MRIKKWAFWVVTGLSLVALFLIVPSGNLIAEQHTVTLKPVIPPPGQLAAPTASTPCINPVYDCGNSEGGGDTWSYICERGSYQAWFGFDVSGIPDDEVIQSMTFTAMIAKTDDDPGVSQRTLWYDPDDAWISSEDCPGNKGLTELVGSVVHYNSEFEWRTFNIDLSQHDWQNDLADNYITLMLTGPLSGEHICAEVLLSESGSGPCLTITYGRNIPALNVWGTIVLSLLIIGSAILLLRRRRAGTH